LKFCGIGLATRLRWLSAAREEQVDEDDEVVVVEEAVGAGDFSFVCGASGR
jgi:hypothetical protein